jgi:hypothetical protein
MRLGPIPPRPNAPKEQWDDWCRRAAPGIRADRRHERRKRHAKKRRVVRLKRIWRAIIRILFF